MNYCSSNLSTVDAPIIKSFKRRESIPLKANTLWQIRVGAVRLSTLSEDGTPVTLGFWGVGDWVGQPLVAIHPCQLECLMGVKAVGYKLEQCRELRHILLAHLHQMQELIRIRQGPIHQRLRQLLSWLQLKFSCPTEHGQLIQIRLTHQEIADTIGTTRVTVTRLMQNLEQKGEIRYSQRHHIVLQHRQPLTIKT